MRNFAVVLATALSVCSAAGALADATDLFREQLDNPGKVTNMGVQYWIELHRGAETIKTNHKMVFKSGDSIRFHVKPNIDGYAYIVLTSGSDGQKAQLFPSEKTDKDNRVYRGKDIVLPPPGAILKFDSTPGTEKLSLIISREKIDPQTYLNPKKSSSSPKQTIHDEESGVTTTIAMNTAGTRDLFPDGAAVAYVTPSDVTPPKPSKKNAATVAEDPVKKVPAAKPAVATVPPAAKPQEAKPPLVAVKPSAKAEPKPKANVSTASTPDKPAESNLTEEAMGIVTVVYRKPKGILCCEVTLKHI